MATTNDARVDTTFIGYFLIGFVLLMFGVLGLQGGELFGKITLDPASYTKLPIDFYAFSDIVAIVAMILFVLTIFAYRTGRKGSAGIFAFTSASFMFYALSTHSEHAVMNSNWFVFVAIAVFFLIFAIYALAARAPKFVAVLLLLLTVMFFFFALVAYYSIAGPGANADSYKAMAIVSAIFAFLGFIVATYLGLAYANPRRIPLV